MDFTYFFTDSIAVEGILGSSRHEVDAKGAGGSTRVLETETDADINNGALKSSVILGPWVVSAGITRRF